ncbi:hypothetical protein [Caballeronia sp. LZ001]|uniref:hypothetical protein n=1 Tax=Caballeronia sp. LZ001 TaxID=3038553 RepID=UPI00286441F3|nr:hypothetical protein [Caballeronia sp. LZ001]MDR5801601.1 hypothetical protein [Caballeronia sp. LZ001]
MNLEQYLDRKYGKNIAALTSIEARHFGIPYPLVSGWERRHGKMSITPGMAERVIAAFRNETVKAGSKKHRERAVQILESIVRIETPAPTTVPASRSTPDGDVRLTANIRRDLHIRLKIAAAEQRTTIGELIERFVETAL